MRAMLAAAVLLSTAACGPRQVEVRTAPTQSAEVAIHFTNNLSKAVNVYVNIGASDMFVRQVGANSAEHLPVPGVSTGTNATLKATTVDGASTYSKAGVMLSGTVSWRVPWPTCCYASAQRVLSTGRSDAPAFVFERASSAVPGAACRSCRTG